MQNIHSKDNKIELALRKALYQKEFVTEKIMTSFRGRDIMKNPKECVKVIEDAIFDIKMQEEYE